MDTGQQPNNHDRNVNELFGDIENWKPTGFLNVEGIQISTPYGPSTAEEIRKALIDGSITIKKGKMTEDGDPIFERAIEEGRERHFPPRNLTVMELRAGDVLHNPMIGQFMFVCRGQHPIWAHLQAVVWCSPKGELSIDALDIHQQMPSAVTNRHESPETRGLRFRKWYLERAK